LLCLSSTDQMPLFHRSIDPYNSRSTLNDALGGKISMPMAEMVSSSPTENFNLVSKLSMQRWFGPQGEERDYHTRGNTGAAKVLPVILRDCPAAIFVIGVKARIHLRVVGVRRGTSEIDNSRARSRAFAEDDAGICILWRRRRCRWRARRQRE
jgi:hypothetical protein